MRRKKSKRPGVRSARGVEWHATKGGPEVVYIAYEVTGKRFRERVGPVEKNSYGHDLTADKARKLLAQRRSEAKEARLHGRPFLGPKERPTTPPPTPPTDPRGGLLFESAAERFLTACADEYSRPAEVRAAFKGPLARAFGGRYLDEITRPEIRAYFEERLSNTGPFADWPRKVGMRTPQSEVTYLGACYTWHEVNGAAVTSPCHTPRTRRSKRGLLRPYRAERKHVTVADPAQRAALFAACDALDAINPKTGRPTCSISSAKFRAFLRLTYYTGARPQSESCALTHGAVELPEPGRVSTLDGRAALASVTYGETKTGADRTVLLHPDAAADLRAVMEERPTDPADVPAWEGRPIFSKRRGSEPWNRASYRKAWRKVLDKATETRPELAGMIVRDLRPTARTVLTDAGVSEVTIRRFLGHAVPDASEGYYTLTTPEARRVIAALGGESLHAALHRAEAV